jgi:hypothetical protein
LAADPTLWKRYVESHPDDRPPADKYDKLLIREQDLLSKDRSLNRELQKSPDPEVRRLFGELFHYYQGRLEDVPPLERVLFDLDAVRVAISRRDWDDVVGRVKSVGRTDPRLAPLRAGIDEAFARVDARSALHDRVAAADDEGMVRCYEGKERLLDDYPAAQPDVAQAKKAKTALGPLKALRAALSSGEGRKAVEAWDRHQPVLTGRKSAEALRPQVEAWRGRNQLCDAVLALVTQPADTQSAADVRRLADAWKQLEGAGGHPDAKPHHAEVERRVRRQEAWEKVDAIPAVASEENDSQLVAVFTSAAILFANWPAAQKLAPRVREAQARLAAVSQLETLARSASAQLSKTGEAQLVAAAGKLPIGYVHRVADRVRQARNRLDSLADFERAAAAGADSALIAAWQKLRAAQGDALVDPAARANVVAAEKRAPVLAAIRQIPTNLRLDRYDRRLIDAWRDDVLAGCAEAAPFSDAYLAAQRRQKAYLRLAAAVEASPRDDREIVLAAADPELAEYEEQAALDPSWKNIIQSAREREGRAKKLEQALQTGNLAEFRGSFQIEVVRKNCRQFAPFRDRILDWVRQEFRSLRVLGLLNNATRENERLKVGTPDRDGYTSVEAHWNFPKSQWADQCLLTVSRDRPGPDVDPESLHCDLVEKVDWKAYQSAGGCRTVHAAPHLDRCYVAVWAVIDLGEGFGRVVSEPLILGRLNLSRNGAPGAQFRYSRGRNR